MMPAADGERVVGGENLQGGDSAVQEPGAERLLGCKGNERQGKNNMKLIIF